MELINVFKTLSQLMSHPVFGGWMWFMIIAFTLALIASLPPRRPLGEWLGDFFVR